MSKIHFDKGNYKARMVKHQLGETSNKNPQIVYTFTLLAKVVGGKEEPCDSYERSIFRVLTENTIDRAVDELKQLGYPHPTFDQLDPSHSSAHSFTDQDVNVYCQHKKNEKGEDKEEWGFDMGNGGVQVKPLERSAVAALNAKFGSALKSGAKPAPAKAPPVSRPVTSAAAVEEVI